MVPFNIRIEPVAGALIDKIINEMVLLARKNCCGVVAEMNGIEVLATPDDEPDWLQKQYAARLEMRNNWMKVDKAIKSAAGAIK